MYDQNGEHVWQRELDLNGNPRNLQADNSESCELGYQGMYFDKETELYYVRHRYFSAKDGRFISQDPIGLASGEYNFYAYVEDTNTWVDAFGLGKSHYSGKRGVIKAEADINKNGFKIIDREVTMLVNGKRIRADIIATKGGKTYVFEVKNGRGRLTKGQKGSGVFNKGSANTNNGLGGGTLKPSKGTQGIFDVATQNAGKIDNLGKAGIGTQNQSATFYLLQY